MCCTFWGSTPGPLAPVPFMSYVRWWGSTPSLDPSLCCTYKGSTPLLVTVPYMSYFRWWGSTPSLDPYPVLFIPILFALCLHIPYICVYQVDFWYPWITILNLLFYVDFEISSKMKLICVHTHYYWSIPFSAVNSIFETFSHGYQIYISEVLIIHFCRYCHLRILSPYDTKLRSIFWGGQWFNSISGSIFVLYLLKGPLHFWLQCHICLILDDGGQLHLWIHIQFSLSQFYLLFVYIYHTFVFIKWTFDILEWQFWTHSFM